MREKKTTPAAIVPTTKIASSQRYGADRVAADREQEADARQQQRHRAAERALEQHRARDRRDLPGWRRAVSKMREASPPTDVGRIWPQAYETKYARVSHEHALVDAARARAAAASATPSAAR